jgi:hypothetical protein
MANPNLTRRHQKIFSENATNNGQFGSLQTGAKVETPDISVLQALAAYQEGWSDAVISGEELPSLEEFNGLHKIETEQLQYLLNKGIPEYSADAEYYIDDIQREVGGTKLYKSITDNNIGNALTDVVNWQLLGDLANLDNGTVAASQAEVNAGVVADKYVAPNTLLGLFGASNQATNGYAKIPINVGGAFDEIIIQWGVAVNISGNTISDVTLPIAYDTANLFSLASIQGSNVGITDPVMSSVLSTSQIRITNAFSSSVNANWLSIGY